MIQKEVIIISYDKNTNMYEGYIYLIQNTVNNKKYVGQTIRTIKERLYEHQKESRKKSPESPIAKAIKKYDVSSFVIEQLAIIKAMDLNSLKIELDKKEVYFIQYFDTTNSKNGYNRTKGADQIASSLKSKTYCFDEDGNLIRSFASRAEAAANLGIAACTISNSIKNNTGVKGIYFSNFNHMDDELLYKIRCNKEKRKRIVQYDKKGNLIKIFNTPSEITNELSFDYSGIYKVCHGNGNYAYGYVWRFEGDSFDKYTIKSGKKKINQYCNEQYIKTFESIKEAADALNISASNISCVLHRGSLKTAGGYKWYFESDVSQPDKTRVA